MNRRWKMAALAVLLAAGTLPAQRSDRRLLDAEFRMAEGVCRAAADSGSLEDALGRLRSIAAQDPNYPGLTALQERCTQEHKKQRDHEDLLFEEGKSAFQQKSFEEARTKFQFLANRKNSHAAEARRYLTLIGGAGPAASSPTSQQDYDNFELATRHFKAKNFDRAKPLFEMLATKGGNLAVESRKYLDQIETRSRSTQLLQLGMQALRQRRYQEALDTFQKIEQQDPGYPNLGTWITQAQTALGKPPQQTAPGAAPQQPPPVSPRGGVDSAALGLAKGLFNGQDYQAALKAFRQMEATNPNSPEIQVWIQKAEEALAETDRRNRRNQMVKDAQAQLRRKEYGRAQTQLQRALALAPQDEEITSLLAQAKAGMETAPKKTEPADRSAAELATFLDDGIREFYAGNFGATNRLLEQYIREKGKHAALAYFFLGAVVSSEYFLKGAKDADKEAKAQEFFVKGRQADPRFHPPREWVSPKIIALYDRTGG